MAKKAKKRTKKAPKTAHLLGITEAARVAGVSRATMHRKLQKGEVSATRRRDGSRGIDPAELVRVFGELHLPEQGETSRETVSKPSQDVSAYQARVEALERENELLRRELADAKNEKNRLLSLLEQRALPAPGWWDRLLGRGGK